MISKKVIISLVMMLSMSSGGLVYGAGIPETLPSLDSVYGGFDVFLNDLNGEVQTLISDLLDLTDRVVVLENPVYSKTSETHTALTSTVNTYTLNCPTDEILVSGGYGGIGFSTPQVTENYPVDEDTWKIRFNNALPFSANVTIHVVCSTP